MPTYSPDLRQRVLDAVQRKEGSLRQIARRFVVSLSFVVRLLQLQRRTGSIQPEPRAGGRRAGGGGTAPRKQPRSRLAARYRHPVRPRLVRSVSTFRSPLFPPG